MAAFKNKTNGTWYVQFRYTDWKGERQQKLKRGFATKKEAQAWEREFLMQKQADVNMTFESFAQLYEKDMKPKLKLNTWLTKESIIQKKILPYFGKRKLSEITAKDVMDWQNVIRGLTDAKGKPYSPTYGYRDMELLDAVMCASGLGYYTSALPLLSGLTYADSFAWEYAGGAFPYILQREGRIRYIVSKVLITSVVSGILVSMSFVLFCGMHILLFVPQMPTKAEVSVVIHEATLLLRYGMAWSLVGLAFSAIVPNPVIAMVSPFCIAQFMWLLSAVFGLPILNVKDSIFVLNGTELTPAMIWIQELVIVGVAITAFSIGVWKRSYSK